MRSLELLSPARNADIGIAAIDCGADAVYIAGPGFGAREEAGNPVGEIARLCAYAHRFGVRIFATVNVIVYDGELEEVRRLLTSLRQAGVDAVIVQDPAVMEMAVQEGMVVHASTQCSIRTPERAAFLESLGCGRLVLERELSLDEVRAIGEKVSTELEFFVHGAVCVCYNGQCYLSEHIASRSANRGACIQACRRLYDLEDGEGNLLLGRKALLSMKDFNLLDRLEDLASAGVDSFKIEGRLKGISYVRNVTRAYSAALDRLVEEHPDLYRRASWGRVCGGFTPNVDKTFNRGYSRFYIDGRRGGWSSMDSAKWAGEPVGRVSSVSGGIVALDHVPPGIRLHNGDGFSFVGPDGELTGFRGDVCEGRTIRCSRPVPGLRPGMKVFRNVDSAFERELGANLPVRTVSVRSSVSVSPKGAMEMTFRTEDGREFSIGGITGERAKDQSRMRDVLKAQISKRSGWYSFSAPDIPSGAVLPYLGAAAVNALRRTAAEAFDGMPVRGIPLGKGRKGEADAPQTVDYKYDIANAEAAGVYLSRGSRSVDRAYELTHVPGAELMRSRYCLRSELGLCPRQKRGVRPDPLYIKDGDSRFRLEFDCPRCEMALFKEEG